jgi:hypothetical protein
LISNKVETLDFSQHTTDTVIHVCTAEKEVWDKKATAAAINAATKTKITYNSQGIITAGEDLSAADIPNLSAAKITSGTFSADRIPLLDANKITSGTFPDTRIASAAKWNAATKLKQVIFTLENISVTTPSFVQIATAEILTSHGITIANARRVSISIRTAECLSPVGNSDKVMWYYLTKGLLVYMDIVGTYTIHAVLEWLA